MLKTFGSKGGGGGFQETHEPRPTGAGRQTTEPASPWATLMATLKWTIHLMTCLWMCNGNSCSHKLVHSSTHSKCVLPESIHNPPPWGWGGWRFQRSRKFRERGVAWIFFSLVSIFKQLFLKFHFLHFPSRVANAKKINLVNLKHEMNIFVLAKGSIFCRC